MVVLVLIFVVYSRRREAHIKYPGPDDDVRENIINYDDEGGGEDDMTAFDITPLQIPIGGPMPELANCKMPIMCKYSNQSKSIIYYWKCSDSVSLIFISSFGTCTISTKYGASN